MLHPRRKCRRRRSAHRPHVPLAYLPPCQESGTAGLFDAMQRLSGHSRRPAMEDVMDRPTTSPISTRKHGDVLIVLSNNPPVNALGAAVRQGLVDAIEQAEADDSVKAVVIACGLGDRLVEGELIPHAVGYAEEVREVRPLPRSSERQDRLNECDPATFDTFRRENARKFRGFDAPEANVKAVSIACEKPYSEGVIEERKLF